MRICCLSPQKRQISRFFWDLRASRTLPQRRSIREVELNQQPGASADFLIWYACSDNNEEGCRRPKPRKHRRSAPIPSHGRNSGDLIFRDFYFENSKPANRRSALGFWKLSGVDRRDIPKDAGRLPGCSREARACAALLTITPKKGRGINFKATADQPAVLGPRAAPDQRRWRNRKIPSSY